MRIVGAYMSQYVSVMDYRVGLHGFLNKSFLLSHPVFVSLC